MADYSHDQLKHMTVAQLRELASGIEHDAARQAHDSAQLKMVRRKIHRLKRTIHKATV